MNSNGEIPEKEAQQRSRYAQCEMRSPKEKKMPLRDRWRVVVLDRSDVASLGCAKQRWTRWTRASVHAGTRPALRLPTTG